MSVLYPLDEKAYWDSLYDIGAEGAWGHPSTRQEVRLQFHKFTTLEIDRHNAQKLAEALGYTAATRLCVYGCGFGWILQGFWELGIMSVQGIENSSYVRANLAINEDDDIQAAIELVGLNISTGDGLTLFNAMRDSGNPRGMMPVRVREVDISSNQAMNQLRQIMGGAGCEVLTYGQYAIQRHDNQQAVELRDNLDKLQPARISHFINPPAAVWDDPFGGAPIALNNKTGEEWQVHLPNDTFVEESTFRVVAP
jgi:hypothetical protein